MRKAIASTILALMGLVATAPAAWGQETQCTGPLPPGTYITVVVPEGASCEINGNTTVRNVQVLAGGNLATSAATITGNITGVDVGFISLGTGTEVGKNVTIGGETVIVSDAEIGGNVRISGSEGAAFLTSSFVGRNVTIVDTSGFPFIEANEIGRNLRVRDSFVPLIAEIRLNTVGKVLAVSGLTGPGPKVVTNNTAGKVVTCHDNEQPFIGGPNTAPRTEGQCF